MFISTWQPRVSTLSALVKWTPRAFLLCLVAFFLGLFLSRAPVPAGPLPRSLKGGWWESGGGSCYPSQQALPRRAGGHELVVGTLGLRGACTASLGLF